jgi:hypothetical protein
LRARRFKQHTATMQVCFFIMSIPLKPAWNLESHGEHLFVLSGWASRCLYIKVRMALTRNICIQAKY